MTVVDQLADRIRQHALDLVDRAADACVIATQAAASRRTGELAAGIDHTQPIIQDPYVTCQITSAAEYSRYQDEGTGIYGPSGQRITPLRPGGVLVFDWPAAGGVVFARSVAGAPGTHFFTEPMPQRWSECLLGSVGTG